MPPLGEGGMPPISFFLCENPSIKADAPYGVKPPSRKWFLDKKTQKILKLSLILVLLIKQQWITWLIYLANKLYDVEKFIDFILSRVFLKFVLFY